MRDIFEEYATVNADDVGHLMTCGDFLRAMVRKYARRRRGERRGVLRDSGLL